MIMGLALVDCDQPGTIGTFPIQIQVARIKTDYSATHTLIGLKITNITPKDEETLNQFIHVAQIEELKRISKKG
jgi:c-di-GMP-binding flagellar brake protein YcgR